MKISYKLEFNELQEAYEWDGIVDYYMVPFKKGIWYKWETGSTRLVYVDLDYIENSDDTIPRDRV